MSSKVERHQQYVIGECEIPDMSSRGPVVVVHGGAWAVPDSLEVSFVSFFLQFYQFYNSAKIVTVHVQTNVRVKIYSTGSFPMSNYLKGPSS